MNQAEKRAVEQLNEEREREARVKRDEIEAEQYWKKNFKIYERMEVIEGFKYLSNQGLRSGVWIKVKNSLVQLNRSLGRDGNLY